jgi:hypothetical protein
VPPKCKIEEKAGNGAGWENLAATNLERIGEVSHPTVVVLNKRILAGVLALMWLASFVCSPLQATGVLSDDGRGGASSPVESGQPDHSEGSIDLFAVSSSARANGVLILPGSFLSIGAFNSISSANSRDVSLAQPGVEVSSLLQNWQFQWRTASEPRPPTAVS